MVEPLEREAVDIGEIAGKLKLDELVTKTYPLEDFDAVVHDMHEGALARGVLEF